MSKEEEKTNYTLPDSAIWAHIAKLAVIDDKPIMLDYWTDSLEQKVVIGVRDNGEKLVVKNAEEYTSPIVKIFKVAGCYIICTENSIYLTSDIIKSKRIS